MVWCDCLEVAGYRRALAARRAMRSNFNLLLRLLLVRRSLRARRGRTAATPLPCAPWLRCRPRRTMGWSRHPACSRCRCKALQACAGMPTPVPKSSPPGKRRKSCISAVVVARALGLSPPQLIASSHISGNLALLPAKFAACSASERARLESAVRSTSAARGS